MRLCHDIATDHIMKCLMTELEGTSVSSLRMVGKKGHSEGL